MTAQPILDTLSSEFSVPVSAIQAVCEMLDAGLSPVFIGRFRRAQSGTMSEQHVRRLVQRRAELEELDRRRGTILRSLERQEGVEADALEAIQKCMDRFELEDLFVPHRRPEPEVQLALDRGLGGLADALVKPVPKEQRATPEKSESEASSPAEPATEAAAAAAETDTVPTEGPTADAGEQTVSADLAADAPAADASTAEAPLTEAAPAASTDESAQADAAESAEAPAVEVTPESGADAAPPEAAPPEAASPEAASTASEPAESMPAESSPAEPKPTGPYAQAPETPEAAAAAGRVSVEEQLAASPELLQLCAQFVNPDRGVHTEAEALSGAVRILSDRLGRSAHLRGVVRRTLRKRGTLSTRQLVEGKKAGRHKPLMKLRAPLRQLQGHKLIALRQAQKERVLSTVIELDPSTILPKVRAALGKHTQPAFEPLLHDIALQALRDRLLPVAEADIRLELKERSDQEALRFLGAHLRQVLLTPAMGRRRVAGVDVNAKGDLSLAFLDEAGHVEGHARLELTTRAAAPAPAPEAAASEAPTAAPAEAPPAQGDAPTADVGVETPAPATESAGAAPVAATANVAPAAGTPAPRAPRPEPKDDTALASELLPLLDQYSPEALALGCGKATRAVVQRLRRILAANGRDEGVLVVNDSGAASYANGQRARQELAELPVPARLAVTLGRRLQDPMAEIFKVDPRHLGLGAEQGLVSKANARRVFQESVESCAAHVGAELDRTPRSILENIPGLDAEAVDRLVERRNQGPIESREALRAEGVLTEAQWTSAVAFLRVHRSTDPLDRTGLHPEQYDLARRLLEAAGGVDEALGRPGATKGLRRADHNVDEFTWRDLMRELSFPGRDPRPRVRVPELLSPDVDPVRLQQGRVIEGVVTNVASFGAFVDVGLKDDAMVHISELASRYVRDARELLSVGATVRARIVDPNGSRMALSLKEVPTRERSSGGGGRRGGGRRRGGRPGGGPPRASGPAGQIYRRDGMAGAATRSGRGFGGPGRGGPGGPGGRGKRDDRGPRDERVDLKKINAEAQKAASNNPFANFFGKQPKESGGESQPARQKGSAPKGGGPSKEPAKEAPTSPAGNEPPSESSASE